MSGTPVRAWVGLGANLGDAVAALQASMLQFDRLPSTRLKQRSSLYRTAPVDSSGPDYLNAVAELETGLSALELFRALQAMELAAGRERPWRNAPRTLDLDLLIYGDETIATAELTVPHPRMRERAFVLAPLAEIAPELVTAEQLFAVQSQRIERLAPR